MAEVFLLIHLQLRDEGRKKRLCLGVLYDLGLWAVRHLSSHSTGRTHRWPDLIAKGDKEHHLGSQPNYQFGEQFAEELASLWHRKPVWLQVSHLRLGREKEEKKEWGRGWGGKESKQSNLTLRSTQEQNQVRPFRTWKEVLILIREQWKSTEKCQACKWHDPLYLFKSSLCCRKKKFERGKSRKLSGYWKSLDGRWP